MVSYDSIAIDTAECPLTLDSPKIETPCLLLDEGRVRANVATMRAHLERLGVSFRPHLKTAKSIDVGRIAMASPSGPAMVSTLREAEYFAQGGVQDMIYGVGVAPEKLPRISRVRTGGADLAIILDSIEQAEAVVAHIATTKQALPVYIEVDADGHRSGGHRPIWPRWSPSDRGCSPGVRSCAVSCCTQATATAFTTLQRWRQRPRSSALPE